MIRGRNFSVKILFFLELLAGLSFYNPVQAQEKKPNILLIMTDQHQAEAIGANGNEFVKTPNLDRLARSGMNFSRAYVTFPLCTPSRSSIFTGKMPHKLQVLSNEPHEERMPDAEQAKGLGLAMQKGGYHTAYGGKWHVPEPEMVNGNGFKNIAPFGDIGLAEKSITYMDSIKDREEPFFLVASFDNPHNIAEWARNQPLPYGNVKKVPLEQTPPLPVNFEKGSGFPEALQIEQDASKRIYPTANYTKEDWRQYRHAYYSLVEKVDAEIGKILDAVKDLGLEENMLIIFTSDHGDGNASHHWNQKTALFEESVQVPFIVSYKGKITPMEKDQNTLISNGLDLYPTIMDYAGIKIPDELDGKSLKPLFEQNKTGLDREFVVVQTKFAGKSAFNTKGRALVGEKYKYVVYSWGKNREQLFDLDKDPQEMNNLVYSKKYSSVLNDQRKKLYQWCKFNDDPFLRKIMLPENSDIESSTLFDKPY
ncbi:sulfatase-like hydrolase/transferase [Gramella sp. AN32]|uniref:Sulfatase n=1 Tax=Christiangramia antarctica TaxID=2058158 RepID=A0ABW5X3S1_9FLAO|nr:sulfatase-like hydrolase/transferase [Gramella sp. AN32]MCM4157050.1 sulfatase [Gramella sp. AN32]